MTRRVAWGARNEGASNHCLTENRSIMSQTVFDFLDDVFENRP